MEEGKRRGHVLMVPYPSQGHINPMLQFSKRLSSKGVKATLVTTVFIARSMHLQASSSLPGSVQIETMSDGFDQGGFAQADSIATYVNRMQAVGSDSLRELIHKHNSSGHPVDYLVYDAFLPWALDVAKDLGLLAAAFFTQMCAVNYIYFQFHLGSLELPISSVPLSIPGLPLLHLRDTPSFVYEPGFYPAYFHMVMNQFSNIHKADFVLVNSFHKLEDQVVDSMSKLCPMMTIGPTVPSFHLDKRVPNDRDYDLNLFRLDSWACSSWLEHKPAGSVVYVSFGSMVCFSTQQMEEIALGLKGAGFNFLWVISDTERGKLTKELQVEITADGRGLLVNWSPQLEVLSNHALGCFLTHCGWNSTIEALSLAVPMVAMPQWTDQPTNAKFVEHVWKVGIRVKVDKSGIVTRQEIQGCLREVMEKDAGRQMKINAEKWKELAIEAVSQGGTSDKNINEFVHNLMSS